MTPYEPFNARLHMPSGAEGLALMTRPDDVGIGKRKGIEPVVLSGRAMRRRAERAARKSKR